MKNLIQLLVVHSLALLSIVYGCTPAHIDIAKDANNAAKDACLVYNLAKLSKIKDHITRDEAEEFCSTRKQLDPWVEFLLSGTALKTPEVNLQDLESTPVTSEGGHIDVPSDAGLSDTVDATQRD